MSDTITDNMAAELEELLNGATPVDETEAEAFDTDPDEEDDTDMAVAQAEAAEEVEAPKATGTEKPKMRNLRTKNADGEMEGAYRYLTELAGKFFLLEEKPEGGWTVSKRQSNKELRAKLDERDFTPILEASGWKVLQEDVTSYSDGVDLIRDAA